MSKAVRFSVDPAMLRAFAGRLVSMKNEFAALEDLDNGDDQLPALGHDEIVRAFGHVVDDWNKQRGKASSRLDDAAESLKSVADNYQKTDAEIAAAIRDAGR